MFRLRTLQGIPPKARRSKALGGALYNAWGVTRFSGVLNRLCTFSFCALPLALGSDLSSVMRKPSLVDHYGRECACI